LRKWLIEITEKEFVYIKNEILNMHRFEEKENGLDRSNWAEVQELIGAIAKDDVGKLSLMSQVGGEIYGEDFDEVSEKFLRLKEKYSVLQKKYAVYRKNII